MIANTQASPLSSLFAAANPAAASTMGSASGASQPRFDLTLLEMTKQVVDSTVTAGESGSAVPEKVAKALESALNALLDQSQENLAFSSEPAAVRLQNLAIDQAAGAGNLTISEHKQLNELVGMAVGKIQSSLQPVIALPPKPAEEGTRAFSVLHSGPQGGTTVPDSTVQTDNALMTPEPVALKDDKDPSLELPQLAASMQAPMIVSTRTQVNAGTNADSTAPISEGIAQRQASVALPAQEPTAIVLTTQAPQPVDASSPAPQMTMNTPRQQQPVNGAMISPETDGNNQISNQTPKASIPAESQTAGAPKTAQSSGPVQDQASVSGAPRSGGQSQVAVTRQPGTVEAAQVEILRSTALPSAIVPGSEVTLSDIESLIAAQSPVLAQASTAAAPKPQPVLSEIVPPMTSPDSAQPVVQDVQPVAAQVPSQADLLLIAAPAVVLEAPLAVNVPLSKPANDAVPARPAALAREGSQAISPMQRFMDETELRSSMTRGTASLQASMMLTRDSFKDLAASITREYSLRESVFQQAMAAIEDASQSTSQIRIVLKPESLGSMEVSLSMEGGKLTAKLIASSTEVRDIFAANLTQFKQALETQGLQVNQLSVAVRADSQSQGQPQQSWQHQGQPSWQQAPAEEAPQLSANPFAAFTVPSGFGGSSSTFNALA